MKNLSTAYVAYGTDNNGWWPGWATAAQTGLKYPWVGMSAAYNNDSGSKPYPVDIADGSLWQYTPDYGVFACPSDPYEANSSGLSYTASNHIYRVPRLNFPGTSVDPGAEAVVNNSIEKGKYVYPQSDKFVEPSNLIFLIDEGGAIEGGFDLGVNDGYFENLDVNVDQIHINAGFPDYGILPGAYTGNGDKSKWYHNEGAAFGFADGHGEIRKRNDEEVYTYQNQLVGPSKNRGFGYSRIWDPAAQAPIVATKP
jgi:prepilin-type processing-associated H-X9-DG protein